MNNREKNSITIIVADDDPDDKLLIREAFQETFDHVGLEFVENGEELMFSLKNRTIENGGLPKPLPDLILLDLNMPKKDGREALKEIKEDALLKSIPVLIFSTSKSEIDLIKSYSLGAHSFITKPVTYLELLETIKNIGNYWFNTVLLNPLIHASNEIKAS